MHRSEQGMQGLNPAEKTNRNGGMVTGPQT